MIWNGMRILNNVKLTFIRKIGNVNVNLLRNVKMAKIEKKCICNNLENSVLQAQFLEIGLLSSSRGIW